VSVYFFDSSAITKRYIIETGTNWVRNAVALSTKNSILISQITPVEVISAVSRLKRDRAISARTARAIRLFLERHTLREYNVIFLTDAITSKAQDLLELYPLKAYDAIQLASALDSNTRLTTQNLQPLIFVCADLRLLNAAASEGLQTHHPV